MEEVLFVELLIQTLDKVIRYQFLLILLELGTIITKKISVHGALL